MRECFLTIVAAGLVACSSASTTDATSAGDAGDTQADSGRPSEPAHATVPSDTTDAATDQPDAATAVDAGVDAAVDLPAPSGDSTDPPGPCNEGTAAPTCHSYRKYKCVGTAWVWQTADQMCCQDARFKYDQNNRVVDSKTGLKWDRNDANGLVAKSVADSACQSYGRLPTTAELMGILIGPPKDGTPTCTPMVDRSLFFWEARPTWTSDGCVDLATGKVVTCTTANLVCVVTK